jgi:maleylacetate reductase
MESFTYKSQSSRVIFGAGSIENVAREVAELGSHKALVLSTPEQQDQAERVSEMLGDLSAGVFPFAKMHVPIEVARKAVEHAKSVGADSAVAIGGGSTVGLGKAIALESSIAIIAIPTTYAGSEMTPIYGVTEAGLKRTGMDYRVLPKTVIYDPDLSATLPLGMSYVSGMNAIAHAAEGLYARDGNPVMSLLAEDGIRRLASGLRRLTTDANDMAARSDCLSGAWLCGTVLGHVGMALHHKICHTLGGSFNLPHAETHSIMLPHALAYNYTSAPEAMERIERAVGLANAPSGVFAFERTLGIPAGLREIGMKERDLDRAVEIALANPYWNPRAIEAVPLRAMLQRAWEGIDPVPE